jgi:hypothetical protein
LPYEAGAFRPVRRVPFLFFLCGKGDWVPSFFGEAEMLRLRSLSRNMMKYWGRDLALPLDLDDDRFV